MSSASGTAPSASPITAISCTSVPMVTLAVSSRHWRWPEARWLAYPLLILVAIKLFSEDFSHGNAATLFVSLAFVGSAVLLVAKVIKRDKPAETD